MIDNLRFWCICVCLFSSFCAFAQEKDTTTTELLQLDLSKMDREGAAKGFLTQTTTITSKVQEKISDAPGIVEVVGKNEILAFGGNTLGDVLNRLTNFYMASPTHLLNNQTTMRGDLTTTYSSHVLLLLNGRPVRESLFGGIDMAFVNTINIESIERIELIRGTGSVLYGTGAFTAVINVVMKKNTQENETHLNTRIGANGTRGLNLTQSYNKENFTFQSSLRYYGQAGEGSTYKDVDNLTRTLPLDNQNFGGYLSAEWKKFHIRGYYGVTSATVMNNEQEWSKNFGEHDRTTSKRGFLDFGYRHSFSKIWSMTINNTINTHDIQFSFYDDYKVKMKTFDNLLEMTHLIKPNANMNVVVGALINTNSNRDDGSLDENFAPINLLAEEARLETNYAFYGQTDYKLFNKLKLIAGLQVNRTSHDDRPNFAPRLGAIFTLPFGLGIKTLYGEGYRTSAHFENDFLGKEFEESETKPETTQTNDIQLFIERPQWQFGLTYYNTRQQNIIARQYLGGEQYTFANQKDIFFEGIEAEWKYSISQQWFFMGNYSYYYSKNDENEEYTSGVPAVTTCAGLAYFSKSKALNIGLYNVYFSKPPDVINSQMGTAPNGEPEEQRALLNPVPQSFDMISINIGLDMTTAFRLKNMPKTMLTLYGENLLGTEVWQPEFFRRKINSVPYQSIGGRAFYLTLGIKF
jgi:outer membrane receptor for ferrienterochelin and colicins